MNEISTSPTLKDAVRFCFENKSRWMDYMTEQEVESMFINKNSKYECLADSDGTISILCLYQTYLDEAHIYYIGILSNAEKKSQKLVSELRSKIVKRENITRISWLNPDFNFRVMKVEVQK